ncbi:MAG: hypothetical protein AB7H80_13755, partial [Candidatus Kapaibacterium sp.]
MTPSSSHHSIGNLQSKFKSFRGHPRNLAVKAVRYDLLYTTSETLRQPSIRLEGDCNRPSNPKIDLTVQQYILKQGRSMSMPMLDRHAS